MVEFGAAVKCHYIVIDSVGAEVKYNFIVVDTAVNYNSIVICT